VRNTRGGHLTAKAASAAESKEISDSKSKSASSSMFGWLGLGGKGAGANTAGSNPTKFSVEYDEADGAVTILKMDGGLLQQALVLVPV